MRGAVESWLGQRRPKQYCSFDGGRSMLEHAWARAARVARAERVLTVIGCGHWAHVAALGAPEIPGRVLEQPANRDTAPGIYFPLSHVLAADAEATVALLPSDHFIRPDRAFLGFLESAFETAERFPDRLVLLAAVPDGPNQDYGWIEAEGAAVEGSPGARRVRRFREKPGEAEAVRLYRAGCLWNTMVTVAKAGTLWKLGLEHLPRMLSRFEAFRAAVGGPHERAVLDWVYGDLPPANFSRALLEPAASRTLALTMQGLEWSDWGRPERVVETLSRLGARPPFLQAPSFRTETTLVG